MTRNGESTHDPPTPQSIPLQDLSRPPDSQDITDEDHSTRNGRARGRSFLDGRDPIGGRLGLGGRYERLDDESPSPEERKRAPPRLSVVTGAGSGSSPYTRETDEEVSLFGSQGAPGEALGFAGLTFHGGDTSERGNAPRRTRSDLVDEDSDQLMESASYATPRRRASDESSPQTPYGEADTTPLTDPRHLQPLSGAPASPSRGSDDGKTSFHSIRLSGQHSPGMLGDDLPSAEAGVGSSAVETRTRSGSRFARQHSLSPSAAGSPLTRAGTMVRKMSQRIVNLSNEPEIVEQSIRRRSSVQQPRPSLPSAVSSATDQAFTAAEVAPSPIEKAAPLALAGQPQRHWQQQVNPLKGESLGIFPANNLLRRKLCDILVHPFTEPVLLVFIVTQTVLLAIDSARDVYQDPRSKRWGTSWIDYGLLVLFMIYTIELISRIVVSGFIMNPKEYSTMEAGEGIKDAFIRKTHEIFSPYRRPSIRKASRPTDMKPPPLLRSFTERQSESEPPGHTRQQQRVRLAQRAFLRHSFNRLDFIAVVSFWISFALALTGAESEQHIYVFRMLSCLRILRLLGLTSGTSVILRSLKRAAPLLVNVAFLIGFFWLLFAIVGVQIFKGSLRRNCVWVDPEAIQSNFTNHLQFCGGHINNVTGVPEPYYLSDSSRGAVEPRGDLCPRNSICIEQDNPYNGTVSFDNILQSLELIFVIMSSNTFTSLMYNIAQTDYLAAALFFAAGIVILSLWLTNLLVAVITSSFQVIREESKASAFTGDQRGSTSGHGNDNNPIRRVSSLKRIYDRTSHLWLFAITYDLIVQASRSSTTGSRGKAFINGSETAVTILLLFEIFFRFAADWRSFHRSKRNWVDLGLAIITTVIQIPVIHESGQAYAWLTSFQIIRIYRLVLALSLTRELIMIVFGNIGGILNLIVFLVLITFLTAIFAAQIFRGEIPASDDMGAPNHITFFTMFNSFLGMYHVLSSENWTSTLYSVTSNTKQYGTAWIGATFLVLWFILSNFIILNMFIAVIQENFDVTEDEKRVQQIKAFLQQKELGGSSQGTLSLSTIFKLGRGNRPRDPLDYGPATMEMLLKDAIVKDFLDDTLAPLTAKSPQGTETDTVQLIPEARLKGLPAWVGRIRSRFLDREPNPFHARYHSSRTHEDLDPRTMAQEVVSANEKRKRAQRDYLLRHPGYNVSLFLFKPSHPLRKLCQYIVGPGRGTQRIEGVQPIKVVWFAFSAFIYAAVVAMVLLACTTTPLYQKDYYEAHGPSVRTWFLYTDIGFAILFTVEVLIKIIADGFFWTPNAYFRGSWAMIDGLVVISLWIGVTFSLFNEAALYRAVGAFKALRALRLLNVSDSARETFHSVIILGGWKIISAAFVSISLLIPFAIYGLNLFNGQMQSCNDGGPSIARLSRDCVGEYSNNLYKWDVLAPRVVSNPYYDFDSFGGSLFILFQIVSQEGWTDVLWSAMMITGRDMQPRPFTSQVNAIFFVVFNLLGAVFVLTLFVSVFMRNYTEQTGVAFLTAEQRSWVEMRKLLRQISPSKRPSNKPDQKWRTWCYNQAVNKHGRWQRMVTAVLMVHLLLLVLEFYPNVLWWERIRDVFFVAFILFYTANIMVRIIGLTWARFRKSSWDVYSIVVVGACCLITLTRLFSIDGRIQVQLTKNSLVLIVLLLIPRNNQLDQLFKTAAASLPAVSNLLATWFVLFLVYAIALTQTLGLTKFGPSENGSINFRTVPKALVLLFRLSCGEGWNTIMEDYATMTEPKCTYTGDFLKSDCGSPHWARALFISWNILSMYIFVSLFVSLIFESFSYVYQRSSGLSVVSREEIRKYKRAWARFDPEGTGYISKQMFPRLLGELSGVFEMRIYEGEHTVRNILKDCRRDAGSTGGILGNDSNVMDGVDLGRLAKRIFQIPVHEIRRRRHRYKMFYEEVLVSADPDRGISFTSVLMILAHYKVINDSKSLKLEEFLRRRARLQRVDEQVRRNVVIGFFDMMYWSRYLRRMLEHRRPVRATRASTVPVPEIVVGGEDDVSASEPFPVLELSPSPSAGLRPQQIQFIDPSSPSSGRLRSRSESKPISPTSSFSGVDLSPRLSPRRPSDVDTIDMMGGNHDRQSFSNRRSLSPSFLDGDGDAGQDAAQAQELRRQDVLELLDNSEWGQSLRRSFSLAPPP